MNKTQLIHKTNHYLRLALEARRRYNYPEYDMYTKLAKHAIYNYKLLIINC
jgi:hypothetical protein